MTRPGNHQNRLKRERDNEEELFISQDARTSKRTYNEDNDENSDSEIIVVGDDLDYDDASSDEELESLASTQEQEEDASDSHSLPKRPDPYDPHEEPYPACPAYHEAYRGSDEKILRCLEEFPKLTTEDLNDKRLQIVYNIFLKVMKLIVPKPLRIGLLGAAGKGKSSLVNSILNHLGLADTSSMGRSCTSVVSEYGQKFDWQMTKFAAEILWHTQTEIQDMIGELLNAFEDYFFNDSDRSKEEKKDHKEAAQAAVASLREMFCDEENFSTIAKVTAYLKDAYEEYSDEFKEIVSKTLSVMAEANLAKYAPRESLSCFAGDSAPALRDQLSRYTMPNRSKNSVKPSLWHFIERVNVGIKDERIVDAFTMVDMPGTADRDNFKVRRTNKALRSCDGIWLVTSIDRVCDNKTTHQDMENTLEIFGYDGTQNIALICTFADLNADDRVFRYLQKRRPLESELKLFKSWSKELTTAKGNKEQLKQKRINAKDTDKAAISEEIMNLDENILKLEARKYAYLVEGRCNIVKQEAIAMYGDMISPLEVVCVSNLAYENLSFEVNNGPQIPASLTGIPRLRQLAMQISASRIQESKEENLTKCIQLINISRTYLKHDLNQVSAQVKKYVNMQTQGIIKTLMENWTAMINSLEATVLKKLRNAHDEFQKDAIKKFKKCIPPRGRGAKSRAGWHPSTFRAVCRNSGDHYTKKQGKVNWNEEFLEKFGSRFEIEFDTFEGDQSTKYDSMSKQILSLIEGISRKLEEESHPEIELLQNMIEWSRAQLSKILKREWHRRKRFWRHVITDAAKGGKDSYIRHALKLAYDKCRTTKGKGVTQQNAAIMLDALQPRDISSPFHSICETVTDKFAKDASENKATFFHEVEEIFEPILATLELTAEDASNDRKMREKNAKVNARLEAWVKTAASDMAQLKHSFEMARKASATWDH